MSIFLSLLSLCSDTLICCLISSTAVNGRFALADVELPTALLDGDLFGDAFRPSARLILLLPATKPRPLLVLPPPAAAAVGDHSPPSCVFLPPDPGDNRHETKKTS